MGHICANGREELKQSHLKRMVDNLKSVFYSAPEELKCVPSKDEIGDICKGWVELLISYVEREDRIKAERDLF